MSYYCVLEADSTDFRIDKDKLKMIPFGNGGSIDEAIQTLHNNLVIDRKKRGLVNNEVVTVYADKVVRSDQMREDGTFRKKDKVENNQIEKIATISVIFTKLNKHWSVMNNYYGVDYEYLEFYNEHGNKIMIMR